MSISKKFLIKRALFNGDTVLLFAGHSTMDLVYYCRGVLWRV